MLITFVDENKIGVYKNGNKELFESDYIKRLEKSRAENKKKKKQYYAETEGEKNVDVLLNCVVPTKDKNKYLYSISVYEGSQKNCFLYYKNLDGKDSKEEVFVSSKDYEVKSLCYGPNGELYATCQTRAWETRMGTIAKWGELQWFEFDSYGENPTWNPQGEFTYNQYSYRVSTIYKTKSERVWNKRKQEYETKRQSQIVVSRYGNVSHIKPLYDKDGNLYYIKRETKPEKPEPNFFVKALLFPIFIVKDIRKIRAEKREEKETAEVRNGAFIADGKKLWINNALVEVKKVAKANKNYDDLGFVPAEWTLIKLAPNSNEKVLAYGVADYDIAYENGKTYLVYTNGTKVFKLCDGEFNVEREALFDTTCCVKLTTAKY